MSADEFDHNRRALISSKLIKFTTMGDETDYYWDKIANKWYEFDARIKEAQLLEGVTHEDVVVSVPLRHSPVLGRPLAWYLCTYGMGVGRSCRLCRRGTQSTWRPPRSIEAS
jgi:hypothetical protein